MLDFNGLRWPHVSVATLRKQADAAPRRRGCPTADRRQGAKAGARPSSPEVPQTITIRQQPRISG